MLPCHSHLSPSGTAVPAPCGEAAASRSVFGMAVPCGQRSVCHGDSATVVTG